MVRYEDEYNYWAEPAAIAEVTGIRPGDLRSWVHQKVFNSQIPKASAGKPRRFPRHAVYEAALLSVFTSWGVPLQRCKIWNKQIIEMIRKEGRLSKHGTPGGSYAPVYVCLFSIDSDDVDFVPPPTTRAVLVRDGFNRFKHKSKSFLAIDLMTIGDELDRKLDKKRFEEGKAKGLKD